MEGWRNLNGKKYFLLLFLQFSVDKLKYSSTFSAVGKSTVQSNLFPPIYLNGIAGIKYFAAEAHPRNSKYRIDTF